MGVDGNKKTKGVKRKVDFQSKNGMKKRKKKQ